jgi:hypothetical protein
LNRVRLFIWLSFSLFFWVWFFDFDFLFMKNETTCLNEVNNIDWLNWLIGCVQLNIKETIVNAVTFFQDEIIKYSPCLFQLSNGKICGIAKEWHTTGHHGIKTGKHEGPSLPVGLLSTVIGHIKELLKLVRMLYCVLLYVYMCVKC